MLVWLAAGLAFLPAAHACSIAPMSPEQWVRSSDVAIYGVVSSVRMLDSPDRPTIEQRFEARVRVTRVFRGMTYRVVRVRGHTFTPSCGIGQLQVRERVGLLLNRPSRPYRVHLASSITLRDLLRGTRGKWRRPV